MCGIAAIFNYRTGEPIDRAELMRIRDAMTARGPDGCGEWISPDCRLGLGHRRLSIIDLSPTGAQPMKSADGKLVVTFNGEIYNYRQLRSELEKKGHRFQSTSDTEVLLHLYETEGESMVSKLRGMYAFAIWDGRKQGLFIARDPFGIKPLYLADDGKTLRVASQVKALLAGGHVDIAVEPAGHVGFFLWGYVPSPYTLYRGIRGLPAGTTLWIDQSGNRRQNQFCSIPGILAAAEQGLQHHPGSQPSTPNSQPTERLRSALVDSIRHHLIADVPVGVFLSSGLDSTTITALASESGTNLRTVTLAFEEFRDKPEDESPLAAEVAARCGARHQTVWVSKDEFKDNFSRVMQAMDQPSCDGINSFFVSFAAARAGLKVALSGLGGDELLGGYPAFQEIPRSVRLLNPFSSSALQGFSRGFRLLSAPVLRRFTSPKYASLFEYGGTYGGAYLLRRGMFMPWELPDLLDPDLVREGWQELQPLASMEQTAGGLKSPFLKVSALEMCWYMRNQLLRDSDWASMDHSVEVRPPLVDVELLRNLAPLLAGDTPPTKRDMALTPVSQLPSAVLDRPKTGFGIPVRQWLLDSQLSTFNSQPPERGLRGWSKLVYHHCAGARTGRSKRSRPFPGARGQTPPSNAAPKPAGARSKRFLVLVSDAFGSHGGMAKFNRDLLNALCSYPACGGVVALPRLMPEPLGSIPRKLAWITNGLGGKLRYLGAVLKSAASNPSTLDLQSTARVRSGFDLLICGHINLLPFAFLHRLWSKTPVVLVIHGIEAWSAPHRPFVKFLARRVDGFVAVSELTKARFLGWTGLPPELGSVLPNCVDVSLFGSGPKKPALLQRYGLNGKTVIMTLGRLASEERYKGFDEMIEVLLDLARQIPNLAYLIAGAGPDQPRLVQKARSLGLSVSEFGSGPSAIQTPLSAAAPSPLSDLPSPIVVFAGRIAEDEKADHYRLADAYVMPGQGEGFGIVYLEAMACGVPVVASRADGSREAVRNGELGELVDPRNPEEIKAATLRALANSAASPLRVPPPGLAYFSYANFAQRVHTILDGLWGEIRAGRLSK